MTPTNKTHKSIRIAIVEPVPVVMQSLVKLFSRQPGMEVVATADRVSQALASFDDHGPDVLLVDIEYRGAAGVSAARKLRSLYPGAKTVFFSAKDDEPTALSVIISGAEGCLARTMTSETLVDAVRSVHKGNCVYDMTHVASIVSRLAGSTPSGARLTVNAKLSLLSKREREIVRLVSRCMTNREIAAATFVSVNTVKTHLRRIFSRLGISSRGELARMVFPGDSRDRFTDRNGANSPTKDDNACFGLSHNLNTEQTAHEMAICSPLEH